MVKKAGRVDRAAKRKPTGKSDAAVKVAALRRELARQRQVKQLAKQLTQADDHAEIALVESARAILNVRGWQVVRTDWLRALEAKLATSEARLEAINQPSPN